MEFDDLVEMNPWWRSPARIREDPKIDAFETSHVQWRPRLIHYLDMNKDRIYTIRGPRQVGKTTLMKITIRDLLNKGTNPNAIMYLTCDMVRDNDALVGILQEYLEFSEDIIGESRRYLFIDEIPMVRDWPKGIKFLVDKGRFKGTAAILTGSHSIDIKYSSERLPGRRGEGFGSVNKMLVPMKFSEYVETMAPKLREELSNLFYMKRENVQRLVFDLFKGKIDPMISKELRLAQRDLRRLFDRYLLTGGIVKAIEEVISNQKIIPSTYELYIRAIIGDLNRWGFSEAIVKQILRSVIERITNKVSLNTIAKDNEIGSHNTVSTYLEALENSFVSNTIFQLSLDKKRPKSKSERKIYISDPFIFHALRGWLSGVPGYFNYSREALLDNALKSHLVEMVISNHLIRFAYSLNPSDVFSHHESLFFWRKKGTDKEVDFVLLHEGEMLPFEVKYKNKVTKSDLANLFPFQKGIVISKKDLMVYNQYSFIPVELLLMLI